MEKEKTVIFVDLANMEDFDLRDILERTRQEGCVEEARCYGDFRQYHIGEMALDIYAMGFTMVHCPSWNNGSNVMKRSDDRLLEKCVLDTLAHRPQIATYVLVTSDADIIPACHSIKEHDKKLVLYSNQDGLGGLLRSCGFEVRQARQRSSGYRLDGCNQNTNGHQPNHDGQAFLSKTAEANGKINHNDELSVERTLLEIDHLEKTSRYLTFMQTVGKIANGAAVLKEKLQKQISNWAKDGVIENYEYRVPAIRLNRAHPLVASTLRGSRTEDNGGQNGVLEMSGVCQSQRL